MKIKFISFINFLIIFQIVFTHVEFSQANSLTQQNDADVFTGILKKPTSKYEGIFISPVPEYGNVRALFESDQLDQQGTEEIGTNPKLKKLVIVGIEFKFLYLLKLKEVFGEDGISFLLNPEAKALSLIQRMNAKVQGRKDVLYTEREASAKALRETIEKFGLSSNFSIGDLVQQSSMDLRVRSAFDFYKKMQYQYQNIENQKRQPKKALP